MKRFVAVIFFLQTAIGVGMAGDNLQPKFSVPRFLQPSDKVPLENSAGPTDNPEDRPDNIDPPEISVMRRLAEPGFVEQLKSEKKTEKAYLQFYPHSFEGLSYSHFKDAEGNQWYGWSAGSRFNWVLWKGRRFWWRDPFAGRWLYYEQRVWWSADGQTAGRITAWRDGEYYLCDRDGNIIKDIGPEGRGSIVSAEGIYQGDSQTSSAGQSKGGHHRSGAGGQGSSSHARAGGKAGADPFSVTIPPVVLN